MSDFWVSILQFSICLALGLIVFGISVCIVLVLVTENSLLRERITELETQLAESRERERKMMAVIDEVNDLRQHDAGMVHCRAEKSLAAIRKELDE